MHRSIRRTIALLAALILLMLSGTACRTDPAEQTASLPSPSVISTEQTPDAEDVIVPEKQEKKDADDLVVTPTPTDTPAPTPTPTPSATPEPNLFAGVWTIEDLPFSLELREDLTYLVTVSEKEREGTYSYNSNSVTLTVGDGKTVELHYYSRADTLKIGDFKLIRDDLIFFFDIGGAPVSFQNENDDVTVKVRGAVVEAKGKNGKEIRSYCFTAAGAVPPEYSGDWFDTGDSGSAAGSVRTYKYDGTYMLWTVDTEGTILAPIEVTVVSGFEYPVRSEGIDYLRESMRSFLRHRNTSTDELNRTIARDVAAAGMYTREGAVTAGVSLISNLSMYGYSVGRQENGEYQAAQEWGVNPQWGSKLSDDGEEGEEDEDERMTSESFTGMGETACIVWAYKQAGLNLCVDAYTPITILGEHEDADDNLIEISRGRSGDIIEQDDHYSMIIDRIDQDGDGADDAYLTYVMGSQMLTMQIVPFKQIREHTVYSMEAVFDGTGRFAEIVRYWNNVFRIPKEELPLYLLETMEAETKQQSFMELVEKLGF